MRLIILDDKEFIGKWTAHYIASLINKLAKPNKPFVLGLPTGSTPLTTYKQLITLYNESLVSFKNVITFNMDEYVGIPAEHPQSYKTFMHDNFFNHIDIPAENINMLDGNALDLESECQEYESKINAVGGIRLFLGGMGHDGHLAFNEPGSSLSSLTRIKTLTKETRRANSRFFDNDLSKVPKLALTVGVGTVLNSEEIIVLASGHNKSRALEATVEGSVNHLWTVSAIQLHRRAMVVCDHPATQDLKVKTVNYFTNLESEAIKKLQI
ncbi:glucosamine-6-phosphate deaminase [Paraglaciecola sp.]|uniref:glucosamine-6-phosphate deaminase n=1 Tax=Paraglaciecola sp. TaxID=1920173 RepID=UPI0032668681